MQYDPNEAVSDLMLRWGGKKNKSYIWQSCFTSLRGARSDHILWSQLQSVTM